MWGGAWRRAGGRASGRGGRARGKQADEAEFAALQLLNEIKKQRGRRNEKTQQGRSEAQKDDILVKRRGKWRGGAAQETPRR